jgi:hypothetical protein
VANILILLGDLSRYINIMANISMIWLLWVVYKKYRDVKFLLIFSAYIIGALDTVIDFFLVHIIPKSDFKNYVLLERRISYMAVMILSLVGWNAILRKYFLAKNTPKEARLDESKTLDAF